RKLPRRGAPPSAGELALLLGLPFVLAGVAGVAGAYPYGATRHTIFLAPFAIAGIAMALGALLGGRERTKIIVIAAALAVCNFFPSPPPMIRARNQSRPLMMQAVARLKRSALSGS